MFGGGSWLGVYIIWPCLSCSSSISQACDNSRNFRVKELENVIVSDGVKRHLSRRHISLVNLKFNFIFNGGCTREEQVALSLKRHRPSFSKSLHA